MHELLETSSPFLFPCTIEYSLICAAVMMMTVMMMMMMMMMMIPPRAAQHGREGCGEAVAVTAWQIPQAGWHLQSPGSKRAPATDGCDPA